MIFFCFIFDLIKSFFNENDHNLILIIYKNYILKEQWNNWWLRSQICYDSMYVEIDVNLKAVKGNKVTSDSKTILLHIKTETRREEVYKSPSESPSYKHLRRLLLSDLYIPSDIVCGNKDFNI